MVAINALPDFATADELEAFTKGQVDSADERVLGAIKAVTLSIRREAGWHVGPVVTDHTLTLDGPGGKKLNLPTAKLLALKSVTHVGQVLDPNGEDLDWSELGLVELRNGSRWTDRYRKIQVVMDHGYEDYSDLKFLALSLASRGLSSPFGATREQAGSMSIQWATPQSGVAGGIVPTSVELSIVDKYRLVS